MNAVTGFQTRCCVAVETLLAAHGMSAPFELIHGNQENYLVAKSNAEGHQLEIFIYEDEAGYFKDRKWRPYEAVDFASEGQLTAKLVSDLDQLLGSS